LVEMPSYKRATFQEELWTRMVGSLDDPDAVKPKIHIYVESQVV